MAEPAMRARGEGAPIESDQLSAVNREW